jgi:hypothetical protein
VYIIAFYDAKRKIVIEYGSSTVGNHKILHGTHAEENGLKCIYNYVITRYRRQKAARLINNFKILIWKQNSLCDIRPVFCCKWCIKQIKKYEFPIENVITFDDVFANYCNIFNIYEKPKKLSDKQYANMQLNIQLNSYYHKQQNYIELHIYIRPKKYVVGASTMEHVMPNPLLRKSNLRMK